MARCNIELRTNFFLFLWLKKNLYPLTFSFMQRWHFSGVFGTSARGAGCFFRTISWASWFLMSARRLLPGYQKKHTKQI
jgi:hypothetical protein